MFSKYVLFSLAHFIVLYFLFKLLCFVLPNIVNWYYINIVNLVTVLLISKFTFTFTKWKFLNERIDSADRVVLITGCDTGFGHLLAKRLDSRGFRVFATCLYPTGDGAQELKKSCSKRLEVFGLDIGSDESVANARKYVEEHLEKSHLWAVVNNAGIQTGYSLDYSSIEDYQTNLNINTLGTIRVTKAFLPLLRKSKGRVVNVTSIFGRGFCPMILPYITSKFAAVGFNGCLRQELAIWGISVVSVEPEFFGTGLMGTCQARVNAAIESTPSEIRKEYGEAYENLMRSLARFLSSISSPKVNLVVNDLESAVIAKHPDVTYRPRGNMFRRFIYYFYLPVPENVQDLMAKIVLYFYGFPTALENK